MGISFDSVLPADAGLIPDEDLELGTTPFSITRIRGFDSADRINSKETNGSITRIRGFDSSKRGRLEVPD